MHHGVWTFEAPEKKDRKGVSQSINSQRRLFRGTRNRYSNRADRLETVRQALLNAGCIQSNDGTAIHETIARLRLSNSQLSLSQQNEAVSPWKLRADALTRILSPGELAIALYHIAGHNGISWDTKGAKNKKSKDKAQREYRNAVDNTDKLIGNQTYGQVIASHPVFQERKRNRRDSSSDLLIPHRDHLLDEVKRIFEFQRHNKNSTASLELERSYTDAAFHREKQTSFASMVSDCPFEEGEKKTARFSYSNELRRLLENLNNISIRDGGPAKRLDASQIKTAIADFPTQKSHTYSWLRRTLGFDASVRFGFKKSEVTMDRESRDIVMRKGQAGQGSKTLREAIGEAAWQSLIATPAKLDRIAEILSFEKSIALIRLSLHSADIHELIVEKIVEEAANGTFDDFKGTAGVSAKACGKLINFLRQAIQNSEAYELAGYDHTNTNANPFKSLVQPATRKEIQNIVEPINPPKENRPRPLLASPVARKAFIEGLKQVDAICKRMGFLPERIHVELGREIGKSPDDRKKIEDYQEKRGDEKLRRVAELKHLLKPFLAGRDPSDREFLRYELLLEQNCRCLYSDDYIEPRMLLDSSHELHIDHILPWNRFQQNGFRYLTLCKAKMNIEKGNRTPFEWFQEERPADWDAFKQRVEACKVLHHRKQLHLTIEEASSLQDILSERAKDDMRKASKMLCFALQSLYPQDGKRHVFARPSELTGLLRRAWGINDLKYTDGKRVEEDTHHAVDALVLAAVDNEGALNKLTLLINGLASGASINLSTMLRLHGIVSRLTRSTFAKRHLWREPRIAGCVAKRMKRACMAKGSSMERKPCLSGSIYSERDRN